jgi:ABC-2 type transport system ATP-binding protein
MARRGLRRARGGGIVRPAVRLRNVSKRFALRRPWAEVIRRPAARSYAVALADVSLEVGPGEFFGLLGPNGAGKTTLFKVLSTLVLPDAGSAQVDGHDVVRRPGAVRQVLAPVIADERSLLWRLSARENLRLYAVLLQLPRGKRAPRVAEMLDVVGLTDAAERHVGGYSTGMKRRLLIARALLARPKVLLLDEPTASLDPLSARRFRQFLREEVAGRHGCAVMLATHQTEEALELCDRLAVLDRGRLLATGTAGDLRREFGRDQCRVTVRASDLECARAVIRSFGVAVNGTGAPAEDGWAQAEFALPGGPDGLAPLTAALVGAGAGVASITRVEPSLAELIERVLRARGGDAR